MFLRPLGYGQAPGTAASLSEVHRPLQDRRYPGLRGCAIIHVFSGLETSTRAEAVIQSSRSLWASEAPAENESAELTLPILKVWFSVCWPLY